MDWANILTDAGTIAAISSGIVIAIQFLKTLYYKLPWGWVQKTPGEVWFALSIAAGLGVAIALNYQTLLDTGVPLMERFGTIFYGLTIGAGSKMIHAVATSAGAKLSVIKQESNLKLNGNKECAPEIPPEVPSAEVETLPLKEEPKIIPQEPPKPKEVILIKSMKENKVYVMIDGVRHDVTGKMLELDV